MGITPSTTCVERASRTAIGKYMRYIGNRGGIMETENNNESKEVVKTENQWRKALIILAIILIAVLLMGWNFKLSYDMKNMRNQQMEIQSQLNNVSDSISTSFSSFADEIQAMLDAQDSVIADFSVKEISRDLKAGTVQYSVSATPKTYQRGMIVSFVANDSKNSYEVQGEDNNLTYTADLSCGFTDNITITVLLKQGDTTQTQVLLKCEGWYSETLLSANDDFSFLLEGMNLKDPYFSEPNYEAFIDFRDYQEAAIETFSEVERVDYYVLVNDKIVSSAIGKPSSQIWGEEEEQVTKGYKVNVPLKFLETLKDGDKLVLAVLINDTYDRRYCATSTGFEIKKMNQQLVIETDEQFVFDRAFNPLN
jgi:hypothetical protein